MDGGKPMFSISVSSNHPDLDLCQLLKCSSIYKHVGYDYFIEKYPKDTDILNESPSWFRAHLDTCHLNESGSEGLDINFRGLTKYHSNQIIPTVRIFYSGNCQQQFNSNIAPYCRIFCFASFQELFHLNKKGRKTCLGGIFSPFLHIYKISPSLSRFSISQNTCQISSF